MTSIESANRETIHEIKEAKLLGWKDLKQEYESLLVKYADLIAEINAAAISSQEKFAPNYTEVYRHLASVGAILDLKAENINPDDDEQYRKAQQQVTLLRSYLETLVTNEDFKKKEATSKSAFPTIKRDAESRVRWHKEESAVEYYAEEALERLATKYHQKKSKAA